MTWLDGESLEDCACCAVTRVSTKTDDWPVLAKLAAGGLHITPEQAQARKDKGECWACGKLGCPGAKGPKRRNCNAFIEAMTRYERAGAQAAPRETRAPHKGGYSGRARAMVGEDEEVESQPSPKNKQQGR